MKNRIKRGNIKRSAKNLLLKIRELRHSVERLSYSNKSFELPIDICGDIMSASIYLWPAVEHLEKTEKILKDILKAVQDEEEQEKRKMRKRKRKRPAHISERYIKGYPGGASIIPDDNSVLETRNK